MVGTMTTSTNNNEPNRFYRCFNNIIILMIICSSNSDIFLFPATQYSVDTCGTLQPFTINKVHGRSNSHETFIPLFFGCYIEPDGVKTLGIRCHWNVVFMMESLRSNHSNICIQAIPQVFFTPSIFLQWIVSKDCLAIGFVKNLCTGMNITMDDKNLLWMKSTQYDTEIVAMYHNNRLTSRTRRHIICSTRNEYERRQ